MSRNLAAFVVYFTVVVRSTSASVAAVVRFTTVGTVDVRIRILFVSIRDSQKHRLFNELTAMLEAILRYLQFAQHIFS